MFSVYILDKNEKLFGNDQLCPHKSSVSTPGFHHLSQMAFNPESQIIFSILEKGFTAKYYISSSAVRLLFEKCSNEKKAYSILLLTTVLSFFLYPGLLFTVLPLEL